MKPDLPFSTHSLTHSSSLFIASSLNRSCLSASTLFSTHSLCYLFACIWGHSKWTIFYYRRTIVKLVVWIIWSHWIAFNPYVLSVLIRFWFHHHRIYFKYQLKTNRHSFSLFLSALQEVGSIIGKKGEIVNRFREEVSVFHRVSFFLKKTLKSFDLLFSMYE